MIRFFNLIAMSCAMLLLAVVTASAQAPRTPWGDPDLQGAYTNSDESLIPMERPDALSGKSLSEISADELAQLNEQAQRGPRRGGQAALGAAQPAALVRESQPEEQPRLAGGRSSGRQDPAADTEARARAAARAKARQGRGDADSYEDRSLYDRCITRGLPGSMMPAIYGNSYEIVQGPGFVAIQYEMVNELRVIPLDGRPHVSSTIRHYMGDARGHFEGETLVVETTNFTDKVPYRGSSQNLRLIERFTPRAPGIVEWSVTFDDPATWARPWTFAMNLTKTTERPFEYACHEGNYAMRNMLGIAREEEKQDGK